MTGGKASGIQMLPVGPQTRGGGHGQARAGALWDRACAKSGVRMGEVDGVSHRGGAAGGGRAVPG
ncbi:hypothetical protein F7R02_00185 [Xanthomonas cissicola]|nr:hypothetical protein F7R02_00185 [Xanthomonas cissicola]